MREPEVFTSNSLTIEIYDNDAIKILWKGRSTERDPSTFIVPILFNSLVRGEETKKQIIMDFSEMEFMNSSSFSPIAKMLERAKQTKLDVSVLYNRAKKWQELSFTALQVFATEDNNISVTGK